MLDPSVTQRSAEFAAAFARRDPFRHVVIEPFFDAGFLARLRDEFPSFDRGDARNEGGSLAGKSVVERIRGLGPAYAELDDRIQSAEFLNLMSTLTGIPELRYDPHYFGGGTHENRRGQDLDPHVDFNRHPLTGWHRRLNLIVYLNPEWDDAWGGSLELHSDPRRPDNRVTLVTPLLNRAVIFETTEWSWHGFTRIAPPAERPDLTRRSIALYFYSSERPVEELADPHSTIYVDRPVDPRLLQAGRTLSADDQRELSVALTRREQHTQRLYRDIQQLSRELAAARRIVDAGLGGQLRQLGGRWLRKLGLR